MFSPGKIDIEKVYNIHKSINALMEYDVDNIRENLDDMSKKEMSELEFKMLSVASIALEQVTWSLKLASDCLCDVENSLERNKDNYLKEESKNDEKV